MRGILFSEKTKHIFRLRTWSFAAAHLTHLIATQKTTITNLIVDEMLFHMSFSCVKLPAAFVSLKYNQKGFGDRNKERK